MDIALFADSDGDGAGAEEGEFRAIRSSRREGTNFLECGTGALAIFLHKSFAVDVTTSDYDDAEIEET